MCGPLLLYVLLNFDVVRFKGDATFSDNGNVFQSNLGTIK